MGGNLQLLKWMSMLYIVIIMVIGHLLLADQIETLNEIYLCCLLIASAALS